MSKYVDDISVDVQLLHPFSSNERPGKATPATIEPVVMVSIATEELLGNLTSCPFNPAILLLYILVRPTHIHMKYISITTIIKFQYTQVRIPS